MIIRRFNINTRNGISYRGRIKKHGEKPGDNSSARCSVNGTDTYLKFSQFENIKGQY